MRRNINVQQNSSNNLNSLNNNRGKSNNPMNSNNNFNNNLNSNLNQNTNLNRNASSNKFGNNNANSNQRNNTAATNKNFKNIKGNNQGGLPDSAVISNKNYAIFQNQDYFNLDNFNYYGNQNQNNNKNRNIENNQNNFNNNNQVNNNNNQRANQLNFNNNVNNNFPDPVVVNARKPNTTTVKSQIPFEDNSNSNNDNNFAKGKKHFSNNQITNDNSNSNQGSNTNMINNNINNNNNNNLNRNTNQNNFNNNNDRGNFNQNKNNNNNNQNQNQNKSYSKTILLKIKAAKTNGIINISNMSLNSLPKEIFDDTVRFDDINWWELADIKKIDASNNQIDETFNNENISFEAIPNLNYLKFSGNNFTAIPDSIYTLYALKFLDFSDNKLRNLSDNIRGLKSLVDLNFSNNAISAVPNEIGKLSELEIMNLSQNKINVIPQGIGNIMKLKRLDLSNNFLVHIPSYLGALYNLEELILFKNKINQIQINSLSKLINLKYLDLHNNNLDSLAEIPKSEKLDTLILGYNKIETIDNLRNCPNLSVLDLNNNKLENFPEDVLNLKNIITLNLMNNSINDIPPALCYLNKLVRLNIEGNPLRKINSKIRSSNAEQIKNYLKTRIVGNEDNDSPVPQQQSNNRNNNIEENNEIDNQYDNNQNNQNSYSNQNNYSLMPSKESNINLLNYYQNNYLKIMNLDIERIPVENFNKFKIFSCVGLDLSNNKLKDLSFFEQLPVFYEMQEFKINSNKLTQVHPSIINFKNLRILEMKNNLLTELFDNINLQVYENNNKENISNVNTKVSNNFNANKKNSNNFYDRNNTNNLLKIEDNLKEEEKNKPFPNLEYLDLSNNKLRNFPIIIKFCTKLNTILLSNNSLTNVDYLKEINNPNLFTLEMGTNKITALPEKLYKNFPNLKQIGIENNDVKNVPTDICFMKNLNKISMSGNPIKLLRANIINGGTKTILEYLRKMHRFTDEEMLMEGEKSSFLNFNNEQVEKTSNKKAVYKNEQSPNDYKNNLNQVTSPKQFHKGKMDPNVMSSEYNDVKPFGNVEIESKNNNRNLNSGNQNQEAFNFQNNPERQSNFGSKAEELDEVNRQILIVEAEMAEGNMPMFKKTDLRKKLNEFIRKRANIMKNLNN